VDVRLRVCDDSQGPLVAEVSQRRGFAGRVIARGAFSRPLSGTGGECRSYRFGWRPSPRFVGGATFVVQVRVRDAGGERSNAVGAARGAGR
jgi:hypothetical protein